MRCSRLLCTAEAEFLTAEAVRRWVDDFCVRADCRIGVCEVLERLVLVGTGVVCRPCLFRVVYGVAEWHEESLPLWAAVAYAADDGARWRRA